MNASSVIRRTASGLSFLSAGKEARHALVLLHGLGANNAVWHPMLPLIDREWGAWIAPDLAGHGRSEHRSMYSYMDHARDLLELLDGVERVSILGHSMGAVVALVAASMAPPGFVTSVVALSMKLSFAEEEVQWFLNRANADLQYFESETDAKWRYLKVAGLTEHATADSEIAASGIFGDARGFRLSMDPRAYMVAAEKLPSAVNLQCNVTVATGSEDRIAPAEEMQKRFPDSVVLQGLGHNAHVQHPEMVWRLLSEQLRSA